MPHYENVTLCLLFVHCVYSADRKSVRSRPKWEKQKIMIKLQMGMENKKPIQIHTHHRQLYQFSSIEVIKYLFRAGLMGIFEIQPNKNITIFAVLLFLIPRLPSPPSWFQQLTCK
jgi:hypothetical protein